MPRRGKMFFVAVLALSVMSACSNAVKPIDSSRVIMLTNGTLIDGTGAAAVPHAAVVIRNGRIDAAGKESLVSIPDDAEIVDLAGAAILPGFINAHVHNAFDADNLRAWAREGVTTVRDLGANPARPLDAVRDELNNDGQAARLVFAGPLVTVPDGYPIIPWLSSASLPCTSVEDARQKIHGLLDSGADVIKIALERGDIFRRTIPVLSPEMAKEICNVAHERGTVVSAHITAARDIQLAIDAGVNDLAHMAVTTVADSTIARLIADSIYWIPTLELWHGTSSNHLIRAISNLSRFHIAGGMVALGTDFEGYTSRFDLGMPLREIGFMSDAGMESMQIIVAATKNAAAVCNLGDELGTIEAGKIADILVVNGNPLEDIIDALGDVRMVIHNGVIIVDDHD